MTPKYHYSRFHVIPNGIDTVTYRRDAAGRQRVRGQWQVSDAEVLIGIVARIDPMKDLTVVLLTNRVYFGRTNDDAMYRFRIALHEAAA